MNYSRLSLAITALGFVAGSATAAPLLPNSTIGPSVEPDPTTGVVVASLLGQTYIGLDFFSVLKITGTMDSWVYTGDVSNPLGGLTFVYRVNASNASVDAINRFTVDSYTGFMTDSSHKLVGGTVAPTGMSRSFNADVVGFDFGNQAAGTLLPGTSTYYLVVQTDAPSWTVGGGAVTDGAVGFADVLVPALPSPGAASLVGMGALAALRRRR